MIKRDRIRTEALGVLRSEIELRIAFPEIVRDSTWTIVMNNDTFSLQSKVRDSISERNEHPELGRPREVTMQLSCGIFSTSLFFVVGGLEHAAP